MSVRPLRARVTRRRSAFWRKDTARSGMASMKRSAVDVSLWNVKLTYSLPLAKTTSVV